MIFLALNCRGLANSSKKLSLKGLIETHNPFVIFLQELITYWKKVVKYFSKLLRGRGFRFIDDLGRSRGNIMGWKEIIFSIYNY
jgi:hypothetical protein